MGRKLDFDLLKQRKIIFDGVEYPVREKTVRDELGAVRKFRERYADIIKRYGEHERPDILALKHEEIEVMTDVISYFCDMPREKLESMPVRAFYAAHSYVLGGSLDGDALNADEHRLAGSFTFDGVEHEIKAPSIINSLRMHEINNARLSAAESSGDAVAEREAVIDIACMCVDMEREKFYDIPDSGLFWISDTIFISANGEKTDSEDAEKNE